MADKTLSDAILLLTKVSSKINDKVDKLDKSVGKTIGFSGDSNQRSLVDKPKPVIITSFGRKALDDLREILKSKTENIDLKEKSSFGFGKILGPALLILGGLAAFVAGIMNDGPLRGFFKILSKGGISGGLKLFQKVLGERIKDFTKLLGKLLPKNIFSNMFDSVKGFFISTKNFLVDKLDNARKFLFKSLPDQIGNTLKGIKDDIFETAVGFVDNIKSVLVKPLDVLGKAGVAKDLFKKMGSFLVTSLKPILKKIPFGVGAIISFGFAAARFKDGQIMRGLIDIASGIASIFPGVGTAVAIGLDVLNMFLDIKAGGKEQGEEIESVANNKKFNLVSIMKNLAITIKDKVLSMILFAIPKAFGLRKRAAEFLGLSYTGKDSDDYAGMTEDEIAALESESQNKNNKKIHGRRRGGPVKKDDTYVVGEAGPEIFVPKKDGNIISNDKLDGILTTEAFLQIGSNQLEMQQQLIKISQENNIILNQMNEKLTKSGTLVNNSTNNVIQQSNFVKQFRESYS